MMLIHWLPERGLWTLCNGAQERVILPEAVAEGGRLASCRLLFEAARIAVERDGKMGIVLHELEVPL